MTYIPPMPVRAFRDEFLREPEPTFEKGPPYGEDHKPGRFEHDPYERCDFEEDD